MIVIVGPTGSGKTALAVDLALELNGEVINVDSQRFYRAACIATGQATLEEQRGVPHHLLGMLDPSDEAFTVVEFVNRARETIADIERRGKRPILAGGTTYYLLALLFGRLVETEAISAKTREFLDSLSCEEMWAELQKRDPDSANRLHPHDERKIRRSLEISMSTNGEELQSNVFSKQSNELLFSPICVIRMPPAKDEKIRRRIAAQFEMGMQREALELYEACGRQISGRGIWQAIGVKEWLVEKSENSTESILEDIFRSTLRYARKQDRMLDNSFCPLMPHYLVYNNLDPDEAVCYAKTGEAKNLIVPEIEKEGAAALAPLERLECCGKTLLGKSQIEAHLRSDGHRKRRKREREKQKQSSKSDREQDERLREPDTG